MYSKQYNPFDNPDIEFTVDVRQLVDCLGRRVGALARADEANSDAVSRRELTTAQHMLDRAYDLHLMGVTTMRMNSTSFHAIAKGL